MTESLDPKKCASNIIGAHFSYVKLEQTQLIAVNQVDNIDTR